MRERRTARLWLRGLRTRLIVAFVLVTLLGAGAAVWASASSAGSALLTLSEQRIIETVRGQINTIASMLALPADQDSLDRLREAVGGDALVRAGGLSSQAGATAGLVTTAVSDAVHRDSRLFTQRVVVDGKPWLLVGTPIIATGPDGARTRSGVDVFVASELSTVEAQITEVVRSAILTALIAVPLAIGLALLASRSVLRPVRRLRDTARQLESGDLSARSPELGADELADLSRSINEMAASVQSSVIELARLEADAKRFTADVSHELRTPLSTLTAVMEVLASTTAVMEPDGRESAQLAVTETRRLVVLVEDLMEVARFDAGAAVLRLEDVDLTQAVRDTVRARGWLELVELPPAGDPVWAGVDARRLDVIVANLVGNALRHGAPPVRVHLLATREDVVIEVVDSGDGISYEALPHVFDRFYKADRSRVRTPGSGLGLSIAWENARLHGGDLAVQNTLDAGARFILRIPRDEEDE